MPYRRARSDHHLPVGGDVAIRFGGNGFDSFAEAAIPRLLRLALLMTGSPHDAWDLVQGTLIKVGARWATLDRSTEPYAYAQRTLLNLHVSVWRRVRRELPLGSAAGTEPILPNWPTDTVELRTVLLPALRSLPPRQRAVVVLRYFEDLTERETADRLACSVGTVKSQHAKALTHLRRELRAELSDSRGPVASGKDAG